MRTVQCSRCGKDMEVPDIIPPTKEPIFAPYVVLDEKFWCVDCTKKPKLTKLESHLLNTLQSPNN
jgi:hypothetical protein